MRTYYIVDKSGARCGCEWTRDGRGREQWSKMCMEHEAERIAFHMAAVATCSHANRDLVG